MPGFTNALRNLLVDFVFRDQSYTPPTDIYIALVTSAPTAAAGGTEVSTSGTGYARQAVPCSLTDWSSTIADLDTAVSTGTTGVTSNNSPVNFGTATTSWGTISHWEGWTAVTGGTRMIWGTIVNGSGVPTPRSVGAGDPVSFPASALRVLWA